MANNSNGKTRNHGGGRKKSAVPKKRQSVHIEENIINKINKHKKDEETYSSMVEKALRSMILEIEGGVDKKYTISEFSESFREFVINNGGDDIVLQKSAAEAFPIALELSIKLIGAELALKATPMGSIDPGFFDDEIEAARAHGIKIYLSFWKVTEEEATAFFDAKIQEMIDRNNASIAHARAKIEEMFPVAHVEEESAESLQELQKQEAKEQKENMEQDVAAIGQSQSWSKRMLNRLRKKV